MIVLIINYLLKGAVYYSYYNFAIFLLLNLLVLNIIMCISSLNIIHSILFLILSFFSLSSILFILNLKFIATMIILIYGGAISVLLIFVLMLLDVKFLLFETKISYRYFSIFCIFFLILLLSLIVFSNRSLIYAPLYIHIDYMKIFFMQDELVVLGNLLFNKNLFHLILIAIILLAALIGSISMVSIKKNKRNAIIFNQLEIDRKKLLFSNNNKKKINLK